MNQTETEIKNILALEHKLGANYQDQTVQCACLVRQLLEGRENVSASQREAAARVSCKIYELLPGTDEPRFSMYDCADAIANSLKPIDLNKLLSLGSQDFMSAVVRLAENKRLTYEGRCYDHKPVNFDIYGTRPL